MTPPIFHLDGISSAGIYASPSIMSIKIKGNSEIECKVDIQKEVFWSTKIEDSGNYRYIEIVKGQWKPVICIESDGNLALFEI